jgi:hypothetical protein
LWLFHNFFQPVMRLQQKEYITPLQYHRKFDLARPPFDRLKEKNILEGTMLHRQERLRAQTNPPALRQQIDDLITRLLSLPVLKNPSPVNVFETFLKEADFSFSSVKGAGNRHWFVL